MSTTQRPHRLWRHLAISAAAGAALPAIVLAPQQVNAELEGPLVGRPFAPVVEAVVQGDLVLAGNSNLLSAGGWRDGSVTAADVDGDATRICSRRSGDVVELLGPSLRGRWLCADNSSSAELDLPAGSRVIAARLYIETSVGTSLGPLRAALDGPGAGFAFQTLTATPTEVAGRSGSTTSRSGTARTGAPTPLPAPSKLYEAVGDPGDGGVLRQAVWDVTEYVAAAGPGTYTVADVVNERVGPWLPYASWAIVAAYDLDPAVGLASVASEDQPRFASRFLSWHDGFQHLEAGSLDVPIRGLPLLSGAATFAKSFHIVARGRGGRSDNLLFDDRPLGNNNAPDDGPAPAGVQLGSERSCNTVTDVQNDSICVLGSSVGSKSPGAAAFVSSADGETPTSGSGVDMDVIRIPDRYLRAAGTEAVVQVQLTGGDTLAPGMIAVSIDVPRDGM